MRKNKHWTEEEDALLRELYPEKGKRHCMERLGRTESAIRGRASKLGLRQNQSGEFFADWQDRARQSKIGTTSKARGDAIAKAWADPNKYAQRRQLQLQAPPGFKCPNCGGRMSRYALSCYKCIWKTRPHPKGAKGHKHSPETRKQIREAILKAWKDPASGHHSESRKQVQSDSMKSRQRSGDLSLRRGYSRGSQGKREDLGGLYVRSSWEANYARYLNLLVERGQIHIWEYEPEVFEFPIRRGNRSYTPDFKIWDTESSTPYFVEVKGWMDPKSKTKLSRMAKYYPEIRVDLVQQKEMTELRKKVSGLIPHWEHK